LKRRSSNVIQKKKNEKWKVTFYTLKKNTIFFASFLRRELFKQNHDDFHAKHFEYEKTFELF
jgi:hypothetical protein